MLALSLAIPKKNNEIFLILPCTEIQFLSERWKNVVDWPPSMGLLSTGDVRWIQLFSLIACWPVYQRYIREPLDTAIISERERKRENTRMCTSNFWMRERERERRGGKKEGERRKYDCEMPELYNVCECRRYFVYRSHGCCDFPRSTSRDETGFRRGKPNVAAKKKSASLREICRGTCISRGK